MKDKLPHVLILIFLFLFSYFYVTKLFYKSFLIYGEEQSFLNFDYANYRNETIWEGTINFGSISAGSIFNRITLFPFSLLTERDILTSHQAQFLFFYFFIFLTTAFSYTGFYLLSRNKIISIISSLLYVTSYQYYSVLTTSPKLIHYLLLPLSITFWLLFYKHRSWQVILLHSLLLFFLLAIGINPPQMIGAYSFVMFFIFVFFFSKPRIKDIAIFIFPYLLNIGFVFLIYSLNLQYDNNWSNLDSFSEVWSATNSKMSEILRFFGAWWDYAGYQDLFYNHNFDHYHSKFGLIITYLPVLILFYLITFVKQSRKMLIKFLLLFLLFLTVSKGSGKPFELIFNTFFSFSIFKIFREPWAKFMPNFIFISYLGIVMLSKKLFKSSVPNNVFAQYVFILTLLIFLSFQLIPLVRGEVIDHRNLKWKVSDIEIPKEWYEVKNWSQSNAQDSRILLLPTNYLADTTKISDFQPFKYRGDIETFFLYSNIVGYIPLNDEEKYFLPKLFQSPNASIVPLMSFDYILNKNNVAVSTDEKLTLENFQNVIDEKNGLYFGQVDIYPVMNEYRTEKIRTIDTILGVDDSCDFSQYILPTQNEKAEIEKTIFIPQDSFEEVSNDYIWTLLHVQKINNTKYVVKFMNEEEVEGDVLLLFVETFNPAWKIFSSPSFFSKPILSENNHLKVNCFSNAWVIPKEVVNNTGEVYLLFQPQRYFEIYEVVFVCLMGAYLVASKILLTKD